MHELNLARASRDYTSLLLKEVSWKGMQEIDFVENVEYLRGFTFEARLSGIGQWNKVISANRIALRLHEALEGALREAGFLNMTVLETSFSDEWLSFSYRDADYEFSLTLRSDGSIVLKRRGSRLSAFHAWYTAFMPYVPQIILRAIAAINTEIHHSLMPPNPSSADTSTPGSEIPERVMLLHASFSFEVVFHQFREHRSKKISKNLDVLTKTVAVKLPDQTGVLRSGQQASVTDFVRMDYRFCMRHPKQRSIGQYLDVRAPSNAKWGGLFFTFSYVGENYADPAGDGIRVALDPRYFLSPQACADAYISFFVDIGLVGFVSSVTEGFSFKTASSTIDSGEA